MSISVARGLKQLWASLASAEAAQLAEFAVSLPLLVVFVVGIYDFGNAFNLKYKLSDAVREGARFAAIEPTRDLSSSVGGGPPATLAGIVQVVGTALTTARVNDCGLAGATSGIQTSPLVWTYTVNTGCPGNLQLTISRGITFTTQNTALYPGGQTVEATQVTLTYPYRWQFTNVIKLIAPNANYATNTMIVVSATARNLN